MFYNRKDLLQLNEKFSLTHAKTLRIGSRGQRVAQVQTMLRNPGYYNFKITNTYDIHTALAVRKFQEDNDLKATESVNKVTMATMIRKVKEEEFAEAIKKN